MNDDSKKLNRRLFIGSAAAGAGALLMSSPIEKMLDLMVRGLIRKAQADDADVEGSRNYVNLLLFGAPVRYGFDHWLRTNASDAALIRNPMISTRLVSSGGMVVGATYDTINYNNVMVPYMFGQQVYRGDGSKRPLSDLLDSMLVIRGYGTGVDGHSSNSAVQMAPLGGASSVGGLAADYSTKTFEAIQYPDRGDTSKFNSNLGKALNKLNSTPLNNLLEGFGPPTTGPNARSVSDRNRDAMDLARARLQAYARSDRPGAATVAKNMENAVTLMKKGVSGVDTYWASALARYRSIIANTMRDMTVPGITDSPIVGNGTPIFNIQTDMISVPNQGVDIRAAMQTWELPGSMAEGFALAEYVLTQGLGTTIEIATFEMGNITGNMDGVMKKVNLIHDMHASGQVTMTAFTNAYFRAIGACILELRDKLKATTIAGKNVWDETVFQINSDFNRAARSDGSGSDHGYNQMITSVYSGIISGGPYVIGNVHARGIAAGYDGSMGIAAPIDGYTISTAPTPLMPASSVAAMLRVAKNPFENVAAPLLVVENGKIRVLKAGKAVA
jgi:hypothetical protein